jgi:hypothetical protein
MEKKDVRKVMLDFLQKNSIALHGMIPELISTKVEDNPPRLKFIVSSEPKDIPKFVHEDMELAVEIQIKEKAIVIDSKEDSVGPTTTEFIIDTPNVPTAENDISEVSVDADKTIATEKKYSYEHFSAEEKKALHISNAINLQTPAKDTEAYEKWKERNKNVKFEGNE